MSDMDERESAVDVDVLEKMARTMALHLESAGEHVPMLVPRIGLRHVLCVVEQRLEALREREQPREEGTADAFCFDCYMGAWGERENPCEGERLLRKLCEDLQGVPLAEQSREIADIALGFMVYVERLASTEPQPEREPDGAALIAAERRRQVEVERWTADHDDEEHRGEIAGGAASYAKYAYHQIRQRPATDAPFETWRWERKWWKPSDDPVRNLVKAGALCAAEIDRILRARKLYPEHPYPGYTPPQDPEGQP